MRYLRTRQAPTSKIRYLFGQIKRLLSYITSGRYAQNLREETARAFDRLWTGQADPTLFVKGGYGQESALMEMSSEKQALIQRLSDKSLYLQDREEKHLYIHPERIALARKNKREQAVHVKEADMARRLASHYEVDVFLLSPNVSEGNMLVLKGKNPDGIVNGVFFDVKNNASGKRSTIQAHFRSAAQQADMMYLDLSGDKADLDTAISAIVGQLNMDAHNYDGFHVVISVKGENLKEYLINKKELTESSFLSGSGLSPSSKAMENNSLGNSTIASKSESVKSDVLAQAAETPSMAEVRKKYEGTDKWMKAPNGERSNLTERQWLQVRTPQFKRWFGDWENDTAHASKIVDENGEPLVVFHGTGERFTVFDRSLIGENTSNDGIWGKKMRETTTRSHT